MLKTKSSTLFVTFAALFAVQTAFAGEFYAGTRSSTEKTASTDPNHESLGTPLGAEEDFTVIVAESDEFWDLPGDPDNVIRIIDLGGLVGGGAVNIDGIGWDVSLQPLGASWFSEPTFGFSTVDSLGVTVRPGVGDDFGSGGPMTYFGDPVIISDVLPAEFPNGIPSSDGILSIELSEFFDDNPDAIDTELLTGSSLTVLFTSASGASHTANLVWGVVPEPSAFGMASVLALGLLLGARRRK